MKRNSTKRQNLPLKEAKKAYMATWFESNREKWNAYQREYAKTRRANDPEYAARLAANTAKWSKKLKLTILLAIVAIGCNAQRGKLKSASTQYTLDNHAAVSYVTPKKDTLYLKNDQLGKMIASTWNDPKLQGQKKPVIIFVEQLPVRVKTSIKN